MLPSGYSHASLVRHPVYGSLACVRLHVSGSAGYVDRRWQAAGTAQSIVERLNSVAK